MAEATADDRRRTMDDGRRPVVRAELTGMGFMFAVLGPDEVEWFEVPDGGPRTADDGRRTVEQVEVECRG